MRESRVLLVGDTRQHEAVEAGRPFAQLQEAGMRTMRLEEIVRQKDPELKQAVEQLARGQVGAAIESLDRQGRVHEVKGHDERIAAIAGEYAKSPESTLVVSPDNLSRTEINRRIHAELQSRGTVSKEEHSVQTLVSRQEMTGADRGWAPAISNERHTALLAQFARDWHSEGRIHARDGHPRAKQSAHGATRGWK